MAGSLSIRGQFRNHVCLVPSVTGPHGPTWKHGRPSSRLRCVHNRLAWEEEPRETEVETLVVFTAGTVCLAWQGSRVRPVSVRSGIGLQRLWDAALQNPCLRHTEVFVVLWIPGLPSILTVSLSLLKAHRALQSACSVRVSLMLLLP